MSYDHRYLDYYVPALERRINVVLYSNAAKLFELLEENGHIDRMKRIEQLGVISKVYKSAYHSRWEYCMVLLHLIHQLNEDTRGLGLRSSKNVKMGHYTVTGVEILQIWVLLFNAGHLPGTFATERGLLRFLKKNQNIKEIFITGLPQEPNSIKNYFEELIDNQNIYQFHKIISCFYLEQYKNSENAHFIEFLQRTVDFYISNLEDHVSSRQQFALKSNFKKLRLLSFLFLDSQHVKFPIYFDLSEILLNFPDYINEIFREPNSQIIQTLSSFGDFLSRNLYHSADSIRELGFHARITENKLNKKNIDTVDKLFTCLKNDYSLEPNKKEWGKSPNIYLIFNFNALMRIPSPDLHSMFHKRLYNIEKIINEKYKKYCQLTYQPGSNQKHLIITLSLFPESPIEKNIEIIACFIEKIVKLKSILKGVKFSVENEELDNIPDCKRYVNNFYKEIIDNILEETQNKVFGKPFQELIISVVKYSLKGDLLFELEDKNPIILTITNKNDILNVKKIINNAIDKEQLEYRSNELKVLNDVLNNLDEITYNKVIFNSEKFTKFKDFLDNEKDQGFLPLPPTTIYNLFDELNRSLPTIIIPLSQISAYDYSRKIAEFDGFGIWVNKGNLGLIVAEAKKQSSYKSSKALKIKLNKLAQEEREWNCVRQIYKKGSSKGAYYYPEIKELL